MTQEVVRGAWSRGERVLWVGRAPIRNGKASGDPAWLLAFAEAHAPDAEAPLVVVDIGDYRAERGGLAQDRLASLLQTEMFRALVDGFAGLQVIQDVSTWGEVAASSPSSIPKYEAELSTFLPGSRCSVLCLYGVEAGDAKAQLSVLETHPHTVEDGRLWENIYAIPPEDLLGFGTPSSTLRRRLMNLTKHREAERARRRHADMIALLHAVSEAGHDTSTVDELMHVTVELVGRYLGWDVGHAFRATNGGDPVAEPTGLWYLRGEDDDFRAFRGITESMRFPSGVDLPGRVLATKGPVWIEDIHADPEFRRLPSEGELRITSAFAVPVMSDSKVLAVLEFFSLEPRAEERWILEIVTEVANQLGVSVERKRVEDEMRLLESGVRHVRDAMVITTADLEKKEGPRILFANPAFATVTGYSVAQSAGEPISMLFGAKTDPIVRNRVAQALSEGRSATGEVIAYKSDGSEFRMELHVAPVRAPGGRTTHFVSILRDVTDQRRAENAALRADHDSLTGLPNRDFFMRRLERAVERARTGDEDDRFAVLFLDLDRFKVVNDSLGHLRGDQLLTALGRRLEQAVRPGDLVARLGGDEFVILLDRLDDAGDATQVAERIMEALEPPFDLDGEDIYTSASVGIAMSDTGYLLPEDILRDADVAMYRAKSAGKARYQFFDQALLDHARATLRLETSLRRAVHQQEFELYYQPIISLTDGRTRGFEALIRWNHPERGLLEPAAFIDLAVETGLIVPIGRWVLAEALRQMQSWQAKYVDATHLYMSVNLSAPEFRNGRDMPEIIDSTLRSHEIMAGSLQIEITEQVLIERATWVEHTLGQIRDMGVRICLDDFGTGYSSLSYLHRFPVEVLKVDKIFIERLGNGRPGLKRDEGIVRSILALATNLKLDVTAEGVENRRQLRRLREMGCPTAQGFYFAKPLGAHDVEKFFKGGPAGAGNENGRTKSPGT